MKIILAPNAGFCRGVKRALQIVENALMLRKNSCFCLHDIVHNRQVMEMLSLQGLQRVHSLDKLSCGDCLIINAHGAGSFIYEQAVAKQIDIIDATCPLVRKSQLIARELINRDFQLIIAGEKGHPEVKGILGWCNNQALVIKDIQDIFSINLSDRPVALISQTTFSSKRFLEIAGGLRRHYPYINVYQTICPSSEMRQKEVVEISKIADVFWVIGNIESANTRALLETARIYHPDALLIQDVSDIDFHYLDNVLTLGITAGASTPQWCISNIIKKITEAPNRLRRFRAHYEKYNLDKTAEPYSQS